MAEDGLVCASGYYEAFVEVNEQEGKEGRKEGSAVRLSSPINPLFDTHLAPRTLTSKSSQFRCRSNPASRSLHAVEEF